MHGITLTKRPVDWEVVQQENGTARIRLEGSYRVHPAAIEVGVVSAVPIVRVMREEDNMTVLPWTRAAQIDVVDGEKFTGTFETEIEIPAGGPYRIDTSLETRSTQPNLTWLYRGDCVLHLCVGDLFLIAGQSNSAGYSRDYCADPPHLCVHLYRNRSRWDLASHPMNESTDAGTLPNEEMGVPGVSPYLSFGKKYYELTGRPVGLIQTALGGSSMQRWNPADGDLYQNMTDKIRQTGGRYTGVLWYQGCSDTDPEPAAHYLEHFRDFVEAVRREVGYEIPFFTMQLNRQINGLHDECWGMVREAQRVAALEIPGVHVLSTTNLSLCDGIHNSAQANVALGEKLAKQCAAVLHGAEEFEAPALTGIREVDETQKEELGLSGIWMELTFSHVKNCLQLFTAEGKESGFLLEDAHGAIGIRSARANREDKNRLYLELERSAGEDALLSFAWEADPVRLPVIDEVTFLPPLSFYKRPVAELKA
ncbi:MAG: sialate O-acetylesterase [Eubacteriales bacterium]|nr:sialate O-acetylesterase [Eubacteriales bacterium]